MNGSGLVPLGTSHLCVKRVTETGELEQCLREGLSKDCHHCLPVLRPEILVPNCSVTTKMLCRSSMVDRVRVVKK